MTDTILAFDFGDKRIGVAVGNGLLRQARALKTLHTHSAESRFAQITELIASWQPQQLVVGLPRPVDGGNDDGAKRCEKFASQLRGRYSIPVELVDERYSSIDADEIRRNQRRAGAKRASARVTDHLAAQVILQRYFDSLGAEGAPA